MKAYSKVAFIALKTPLVVASLPKRLDGKKRRPYSFTVFSWQLWKEVSRRRKADPRNFLTFESFWRYVNRIDAAMDKSGAPHLAGNEIIYRRDPEARSMISGFVKQVKSSSLSASQKREIFHLAGKFRKHALRVMGDFDKIKSPSFSQVLKMKKDINSGLASSLFEILCVTENIPVHHRKKIEQAFSDITVAGQVLDDILDVKEDLREHVPNLCVSALMDNLVEYQRVADIEKLSINWFRKNCPKTFERLMNVFEVNLAKIPLDSNGYRLLEAVPRLFLRGLLLSRLKK